MADFLLASRLAMLVNAQIDRGMLMLKCRKIMALFFCLAACQSVAQDILRINDLNIRREQARQQELAALKSFLNGRGIPMTKQGIKEYLQELADSDRDQSEIKRLIVELGANQFADREAAQQSLLRLWNIPTVLLEEASKDANLERSLRAKVILRKAKAQRKQTIQKAFHAIELLSLAGLAKEVIETVQLVQDEDILQLLRPVLVSTVVATDFPLIESLIDKNPALRNMAIHAIASERLAKVEGVRERLDALWNHGNPADRLASTESLLARGNRDALNRFVKLLESNEVSDRYKAARRLWRATGQPIPFNANATPEKRAEQVAAWKAWIDKSGAKARLQTKFLFERSWGRTLIASDPVGSDDEGVVEYDLDGKQTWRVDLKSPNVCWAAENGERVVGSNNVTIVYAAGDGPPRELWRIRKRVYMTPRITGKMLVWSYGGWIGEYDLTGQKEWETNVIWKGKPRNALQVAPLPNGNLQVDFRVSQKGGAVVTDTAIELDRDGKLVQQIPEYLVRILQVLPNGNSLVRLDPASGRRGNAVEERNSNRKVLWSYRTTRGAVSSAQRLANGNTLVGVSGYGPKEIRPDGTVAWELKVAGTRAVYRY